MKQTIYFLLIFTQKFKFIYLGYLGYLGYLLDLFLVQIKNKYLL